MTKASKKQEPKATERKASKKLHLKPGQVFVRQFKGTEYRLLVTKDGFKLGDEVFTSMSAAAQAVTKYSAINGRIFWNPPTTNGK
jgi:hypothetical protein